MTRTSTVALCLVASVLGGRAIAGCTSTSAGVDGGGGPAVDAGPWDGGVQDAGPPNRPCQQLFLANELANLTPSPECVAAYDAMLADGGSRAVTRSPIQAGNVGGDYAMLLGKRYIVVNDESFGLTEVDPKTGCFVWDRYNANGIGLSSVGDGYLYVNDPSISRISEIGLKPSGDYGGVGAYGNLYILLPVPLYDGTIVAYTWSGELQRLKIRASGTKVYYDVRLSNGEPLESEMAYDPVRHYVFLLIEGHGNNPGPDVYAAYRALDGTAVWRDTGMAVKGAPLLVGKDSALRGGGLLGRRPPRAAQPGHGGCGEGEGLPRPGPGAGRVTGAGLGRLSLRGGS